MISSFNTSICLVIKSKGIKIRSDQIILCISTSSGSTLATCLKYIGAIAPQNKNAETAYICPILFSFKFSLL